MHGCRLSTIPSTRRNFWSAKLTGNKMRDMKNVVKLEKDNWNVVTIWECETEDSLEKALTPLLNLLKQEAGSDDNS